MESGQELRENTLKTFQFLRKYQVLFATVDLILISFLDMLKIITLDAWSVALLIAPIVPWAFPAMLVALSSLGSALGKADLWTIQIGALKIERLERKVSEQDVKIDAQRQILDDIALYAMAYYIYDKLKYICTGYAHLEYIYHRDEAFDHDLRYLRDHGYLEMFQLSELEPGHNLAGRLKVTEMGRRFVELKEARLRQVVASSNIAAQLRWSAERFPQKPLNFGPRVAVAAFIESETDAEETLPLIKRPPQAAMQFRPNGRLRRQLFDRTPSRVGFLRGGLFARLATEAKRFRQR